MKFWQLVSIAREQPELVLELASGHPEWLNYAADASNISVLVANQDRHTLDQIVDPMFAEAVLSGVRQRYYFGNGWLRSSRLGSEEEISALEAARRFGGDAVEDAREYGSVAV